MDNRPPGFVEHLNNVSRIILASALEVHKEMGPGLLESVYQACMVKELRSRGLSVESFVPVPLYYKGEALNKTYVIDILVEAEIILELKSVEELTRLFQAQTISYLRLAQKPLGFLINFNVELLKHGFRRLVNNL